jgi:hypothetical protein
MRPLVKRLPDADNAMLRQMAERGVFAPEEFEAWLAERGRSWQGLERGDYGLTLDHAMLAFVLGDPVRFCETFLVEPRTGEPWRFFDYQKASIRAWRQDVVHQDAAEVGKTREIVCLILWGMITAMGGTVKRPWMLIGTPQQTHGDEIILAVEEQMGVHLGGEHAKGTLLSQFWLKPKRTPHIMHQFITIPLDGEKPGTGRVYYRPAGHDGEAFRGIHCGGMLLMDEAAKLKRPVQWSEFWRSATPGCVKRVYSVPDGDRSTEFFRLTQQAVPNLAEDKPGWRLFHWPKLVMPPPFWTPQRDEQFTRDFGGRQTPGYKRNVLGEWGDAENPVWSWDTVLPCVHDLPSFRIVKLTADQHRGELAIEVKRVALHMEGSRKTGADEWLVDTTVDLAPFIGRDDDAGRRTAVRALLREHLEGAARGVFWAGADLGESNDPTEIILAEEIGTQLVDVLRLHAHGFPYYLQRELIFSLQELFGLLPHWGVDLGSAGTAVVRDLQALDLYADARFDETMTGFQFASSVDCIGEDGEPLIDNRDDKDGDPVIIRAPAKHWATQSMTRRLQARGYAMAYDTEALNYLTNHTSREGSKWPIYSKRDDHTIDARRVQMLRKLYDDAGGQINAFSVGAHERRAA